MSCGTQGQISYDAGVGRWENVNFSAVINFAAINADECGS